MTGLIGTEWRPSSLSRAAALSLFFVFLVAGEAMSQAAPDRSGFTLLVDAGIGVQRDAGIQESATGFAGVNLGIGAFPARDLALMFRITGTNVSYDLGSVDYGQVSGFVGPALQFWLSDRFNIEAGIGAGFWNGADESDAAVGLNIGAGVTLWNRGKHNLQFGVQYAPAFTDPGTVHNIGLTFGYQFL